MPKYILRYSIIVESNLHHDEMNKDIAIEYILNHLTSIECPEEFVAWKDYEEE